jgi:hypothetical protein
MKKTWIKIKRGLLKPEHRRKLGVKVWLYMYMLDKVEWETGIIEGWKDKDEAEDFGMPWRTLQKQRQEIEEDGYISCIKRKYSQDIVIHKWVNPREYGGEEYNTDKESTQLRVHSRDNGNESTHESTRQPLSKVGTPTFNPQITNHKGGINNNKYNKDDIAKLGGAGFYIFNLVGYNFDDADNKLKIAINELVDKHGAFKICELSQNYVDEFPDASLPDLLQWIRVEAPKLPTIPLSEREGEYY